MPESKWSLFTTFAGPYITTQTFYQRWRGVAWRGGLRQYVVGLPHCKPKICRIFWILVGKRCPGLWASWHKLLLFFLNDMWCESFFQSCSDSIHFRLTQPEVGARSHPVTIYSTVVEGSRWNAIIGPVILLTTLLISCTWHTCRSSASEACKCVSYVQKGALFLPRVVFWLLFCHIWLS